jgi:hypothetical protein
MLTIKKTKDEVLDLLWDTEDEILLGNSRWGTRIEFIVKIDDKFYSVEGERIPEEGIQFWSDEVELTQVEKVEVVKHEWVIVK